MYEIRFRNCTFFAALLVLLWLPFEAAGATVTTASVFRRYADRVVKIQVMEFGSSAKAGVGTGFYVSQAGHVVTNYHVVSKVIHEPKRYRAEAILESGKTEPVEILSVDVVHDLAVVMGGSKPVGFFDLAMFPISQGDRLYSLGHPHDLGLSIVEGTYNGHLKHTLYEKIHFTGSINPGMSGGPTILEDGKVIGINVASAGNQVSFLVPVQRAAQLLAPLLLPGFQKPSDFLPVLARQLHDYQNVYVKDILTAKRKTVKFLRYSALTEPTPFFRCWGDVDHRKDKLYESTYHRCSTDDYLYISGDHWSGIMTLGYELVTTTTLTSPQFFSVYSETFADIEVLGGTEENVTNWRCVTRNLTSDGTPLRTMLCLRRYLKLPGLYDAVSKTAVLGASGSGLVSTLTMSGLSYESVALLNRYLLGSIQWR